MAYLCCINKLSVYLFLYFAISETNRLSLSLTSTKMRLLTTLLPCLGVITAVIGTDGEAVVPQGLNENQKTLYANDWADRIWKQIQSVSSCSGCQVSCSWS